MVKIKDVTTLQEDTENHPIIRDQMAKLNGLLMYTFCSFLAPVLDVAHTINNLDLGNDKWFQDEDYKSN